MYPKNYTEEEKRAALQTSLTDLAKCLGYTPVKKGSYYSLKEMDSLMIKNDRTWARWSRIMGGESGGRGGDQISFMMEFGNCSTVPEAIHRILDLNRIHVFREVEIKKEEEKPHTGEMVLPEKAEGKFRYLYAYLCNTRKISVNVVNYFVSELKILYESKKHHNLVFLGKDKNGDIKYAMQRGTADAYGYVFKGDVPGNDKSHGINIVNEQSDVLKVFESGIDCMSYINITGDYESNKIVLGMLSDKPLQTFLKEHGHIKEINFCLDNDVSARNAVKGFIKEKKDSDGTVSEVWVPGYLDIYREQGYIVKDNPALPFGKDYNENLKYYREFDPDKIKDIRYPRNNSRKLT